MALTELPFPVGPNCMKRYQTLNTSYAFLIMICLVHMLYRKNNKKFFTATGLLSPLKIISCTFQL